jgi:Asp-tRNA(Asn)/Glu-tRNA(Gln) amidotransferase A subunit family amidase
VDAALAGHDALAVPTLPIPAPLIGSVTLKVGAAEEPIRNLMLRLTSPFNATGHPAIALPNGTLSSGLPCSTQLIGMRGQTDGLMRVALTVEDTLRPR